MDHSLKSKSLGKGRWCLVPNCYNKRQFINTVFFSLPKEKFRCDTWLNNCGRTDLLNKKLGRGVYVMCAHHFDEDNFMDPLHKSLKPNAVPTIFPTSPKGSLAFPLISTTERKRTGDSVNNETSSIVGTTDTSSINENTQIADNIGSIEVSTDPNAYPVIERIWSLKNTLLDNAKVSCFPNASEGCSIIGELPTIMSTAPENISNADEWDKKDHDYSLPVTMECVEDKGCPITEEIPTVELTSPEKIVAVSCPPDKSDGCNVCETEHAEVSNKEVLEKNCNDASENNEEYQDLESRSKINTKKFHIRILKIDKSVQRIHTEILSKMKCEQPMTFKIVKLVDGSLSKLPQIKGDEKLLENGLSQNKSVSSKILLMEKEISMEDLYKSSTAGRECKEMLLLKLDQSTKSEKSPTPKQQLVQCAVNGNQFNNGSILLVHQMINFCEKSNENEVSKIPHSKDHPGEKSYLCSECGKKFSSRTNFKLHERIHSGEKPYECDVCGKKFSRSSILKIHKRIHTGEKPYLCSECGKKFNNQTNFQLHERIHSGKKPYKCNVCEKAFRRKDHLKVHKVTHTGERPYECKVCGKKFSSLSCCSAHKKIHIVKGTSASKVKSYECKVCQAKYFHPSALTSHARKHSGETPYECKVCGKKFYWFSGFKMHERTHTGEKPYECNVCGKSFSQKSSLKNHTVIHSGDRPYKCDICEKKFSLKHHLKTHSMLHIDKNT